MVSTALNNREEDAFTQYKKFLNERLSYPGLDYASTLTFLNYYFGFTRSILYLVHKDPISKAEGEQTIVQTAMAIGPGDKQEHLKIQSELSGKTLDQMLDGLYEKEPSSFDETARKFSAEFMADDVNPKSVLEEVCLRQTPRVVYPEKEDIEAEFNRALFKLYNHNAQDDKSENNFKPFILIPLVGTNKKTFALIGANKIYDDNSNLEEVLSRMALPILEVTTRLQHTKAQEKLARKRAYLISDMLMKNTIGAVQDQVKNPLISIGISATRIKKKLNGCPNIDQSIGKNIDMIIADVEKLESGLESLYSTVRGTVSPPEKISLQSFLDIVQIKYGPKIVDDIKGKKPMLYLSDDIIKPLYQEIFNTIIARTGTNPVHITGRKYKPGQYKHNGRKFDGEMYELSIYCPNMHIPGNNKNLKELVAQNGNSDAIRPLLNAQTLLELGYNGGLKLRPVEEGTYVVLQLPVYKRTLPSITPDE